METNFDLEEWIPTKQRSKIYERDNVSFEPEETEEPTGSYIDAFRAQRDEVHVLQNLHRLQSQTSNIDLDFLNTLSLERIEQDMEGMDVKEYDHEWLASSPNQVEYNRRLYRSLERERASQAVEAAGGLKGTLATLGAYATDPIGVAVDAASGGSSKVKMLSRFIEAGGRAAVADIATEALRLADGEPDKLQDVAIGTLTAFGTGGLFGLSGRKVDVKAQVAEEEYQAMRNVADTLKPQDGKKSAGAAQAPDVPEDIPGRIESDKVTMTDELLDRAEAEGFSSQYAAWAQIGQASRAQRTDAKDVRVALDDVHGSGVTKKGEAREMPMEVENQRLKDKFSVAFNRSFSENFTAYQKEVLGQNALTRQWAHKDAQNFSNMVGQYMLGITDDVPQQVKQVAKDSFQTFRDWKEYAVNSGKMSPKQFSDSADWMPNMFTQGGISRILHRVGGHDINILKPLIVKAITNGRKAVGLDVDDNLTDVVAQAYLNRAWGTGDGMPFKDSRALDLEDVESLKQLIDEYVPIEPEGKVNYDIEAAKVALDNLATKTKKKASEESGQIEHLQSRLLLDREAAIEINGQTVKLAELYETDISKIMNSYNNKMSAEMAFMDKGWTTKKFEAYLKEKESEVADSKKQYIATGQWPKNRATERDLENLQFAYDRMLHKGVRLNNDRNNALLKAVNDYVYSSKMSSAGLNGISEAMNAFALSGLKGFVGTGKYLKDFIKSYVGKKPPTDQVRLIQSLSSGIADRVVENKATWNIQDDVSFGTSGTIGKVVSAADGAKRVTNNINFLSHITDISSSLSNAAVFNRLDDVANGRKVPNWTHNRLKTWGFHGEREELIRKWMSSDAVKRDKSGAIVDYDVGKLDFKTQKALEQVLYRATSRNIQKVFSGDLPKFMQNPIGAFVMKFRSFTMAAHGNHMLDDLNHKDWFALNKLILTGGMGMFMYVNREYLNNPFNEKERKKKITWENTLRSGATYAVNVALLPALVDTASEIVLGAPIVGKKRTSGLNSGFSPKDFAGNIPGVSMAADALKVMQGAGALVRGGELSKEQVRAIFSILMLDTAYLTRGLRTAAVREAPNSRKADQNDIDLMEEFKDAF